MDTTADRARALARTRGGKYLTFALDRELYALPILKVRELIGYMEVTGVPRMPPYVHGVINLRGQVISVIDLRARFGMASAARTEQTCIVVAEVQRDGRALNMGLVVDRVSEVLLIAESQIEDAPSLGCAVSSDFILGMGKVGKNVHILLNIDQILTFDEFGAVQAGSVA